MAHANDDENIFYYRGATSYDAVAKQLLQDDSDVDEQELAALRAKRLQAKKKKRGVAKSRPSRPKKKAKVQPASKKTAVAVVSLVDDDVQEEDQEIKLTLDENDFAANPQLAHSMQLLEENRKLALLSRRSAENVFVEEDVADTVEDTAVTVSVRYKKITQTFKYRPEANFLKLHEIVASVHGLPSEKLIFKIRGLRIDLTQTLSTYGINDGDEIVAELEDDQKEALSEGDTLETTEESGSQCGAIAVKVRYSKQEKRYKIKTCEMLEKLQKAVARIENIEPASRIHLIFDGERLNMNDTPLDYDMEDGDIIEVAVAPASRRL